MLIISVSFYIVVIVLDVIFGIIVDDSKEEELH
jgi:hypothetical protein